MIWGPYRTVEHPTTALLGANPPQQGVELPAQRILSPYADFWTSPSLDCTRGLAQRDDLRPFGTPSSPNGDPEAISRPHEARDARNREFGLAMLVHGLGNLQRQRVQTPVPNRDTHMVIPPSMRQS